MQLQLYLIGLIVISFFQLENMNKIDEIENRDLEINETGESFLGTWLICQEISDSQSISYAACPKIIFYSNSFGKINFF